MLKIYKITCNDGGWHSGPLPNYTVVEESEDKAKEIFLNDFKQYRKGWDVWVSEFKMDGYIIEVYDEKTYNREKNLEKLLDSEI